MLLRLERSHMPVSQSDSDKYSLLNLKKHRGPLSLTDQIFGIDWLSAKLLPVLGYHIPRPLTKSSGDVSVLKLSKQKWYMMTLGHLGQFIVIYDHT